MFRLHPFSLSFRGVGIIMALFFGDDSWASKAESKVFRVGCAYRLNNKFDSDTVYSLLNGVRAAKRRFEETHPHVKIKLVEIEHENELKSVVNAADRVLAEKLPAVIGAEKSSEAVVMGDILSPKGVILLSPTASIPTLAKNRPNVFSGCFSDDDVARKLARYVLQKSKPKVVGILKKVGSPHSELFSTIFKEELSKTDPQKKIVERTFMDTKTDYAQIIADFKKSGVDTLGFFAYQNDLFEFNAQASKQDFFPLYLGTDAWGNSQRLHQKLVTEGSHGDRFDSLHNAYWKIDSDTEESKRFRASMKKVTKDPPTEAAAVTYDAAIILFEAMLRANDPDKSSSIRAELVKTNRDHMVTSRKFIFGPNNIPEKEVHLYRINSKGIRYEKGL